jgi:small subunit ribosomal protein S8e
LSIWHGDQNKKKPTGGRKRPHRKKRSFERGSFPAETILGETKQKIEQKKGRNVKIKLLRGKNACITDAKKGKTEKVEIKRVIENPANIDYDRRGVITKGAIIETTKGRARVTSRPGQHGVINAILITKNEK